MSVKSYISQNFSSISYNDVSKAVQINQLPSMKNPFLVIAFPSSLQVKDRRTYSFQTFGQECIQQQAALTLSRPNFYEKLDKFSFQEDLSDQMNEQQNGLVQIKNISNNIVQRMSQSASNQYFDDILSQIQFENKNQCIQKIKKIQRNNFQSYQDEKRALNQNYLNSQKKSGTIVKNLYKRNRLSSISTATNGY